MADRVVIRAHAGQLVSVIAAMVFGAFAVFGLRIVIVAIQLGEWGTWVAVVLALSLIFVLVVINVLWAAFGVALILSRRGIYKPGPFGGRRIARDGLRVGRYDTVRSNFSANHSSARARASKTTEFWALSPAKGAVLIWDGPRGAPDVTRIEAALAQVMGIEVAQMPQGGKAGFDAQPR